MKFGKLMKGLGKKASSLGSKLKARAAGYKSLGKHEKLLGGTTKSAASKALAPVKARAKAMGTKVRDKVQSMRGGGGKKTGFSNFDGPYKPSKDDGFGSVLGKNSKKSGGGFDNFDGPYKPSKDDGFGMTFEPSFPKQSRSQRLSATARNMKARASDRLESAKGRLNEYRTGKRGGGGKKSSAPDDFSTTMDFDSVFPKASRGQRAKMTAKMAKGRATDMMNSAKSRLGKYGRSARAGVTSSGISHGYDQL